jgi:TonB family protein
MKPASVWMRLLACLAVSCLLHAALLFVPYLGMRSGVWRPALQGGQKSSPPRSLDATLALEQPSALAAAEASPEPAEGGKQADAAAGGMTGEEPRQASELSEGAGLLPLPAPTYYTVDQLTKRPQPTAEPELNAPEIATIDASGTVILKLWINELGNVVSVDVEHTNVPEIISQAAVAAFKRLRFTPGERDGLPVGTLLRIEVRYDRGWTPPKLSRGPRGRFLPPGELRPH